IFQSDRTSADQAPGIVTAILSRPIIEGPEASAAQFGVIESEQQHPHRGVKNLATHTVAILLLEAFRGIPNAVRRRIETALDMIRKFLGTFPRTEEAGHRDRLNILAHEEFTFAVPVIFLGMRRMITETLLDALRPHIGRFDKVRIRRNDSI